MLAIHKPVNSPGGDVAPLLPSTRSELGNFICETYVRTCLNVPHSGGSTIRRGFFSKVLDKIPFLYNGVPTRSSERRRDWIYSKVRNIGRIQSLHTVFDYGHNVARDWRGRCTVRTPLRTVNSLWRRRLSVFIVLGTMGPLTEGTRRHREAITMCLALGMRSAQVFSRVALKQ